MSNRDAPVPRKSDGTRSLAVRGVQRPSLRLPAGSPPALIPLLIPALIPLLIPLELGSLARAVPGLGPAAGAAR